MANTLGEGKASNLVLTLGSTRKDNGTLFINFDDYRQDTQGRFFAMYRQVGLEGVKGGVKTYQRGGAKSYH